MDILRLPAAIESVEACQRFVHQKLDGDNIPKELFLKIELVIEEVLVNIASYAYPDNKGEIEFSCELQGEEFLILIFRDRGVKFDPASQSGPNLTDDLQKRTPGGLGIHLVRELSEEMNYSRNDNQNVLRLKIRIKN